MLRGSFKNYLFELPEIRIIERFARIGDKRVRVNPILGEILGALFELGGGGCKIAPLTITFDGKVL